MSIVCNVAFMKWLYIKLSFLGVIGINVSAVKNRPESFSGKTETLRLYRVQSTITCILPEGHYYCATMLHVARALTYGQDRGIFSSDCSYVSNRLRLPRQANPNPTINDLHVPASCLHTYINKVPIPTI